MTVLDPLQFSQIQKRVLIKLPSKHILNGRQLQYTPCLPLSLRLSSINLNAVTCTQPTDKRARTHEVGPLLPPAQKLNLSITKFNYLFSSFDVRGRQFTKALYWSDTNAFGPRAYFHTKSKPATLNIDNIQLDDEGVSRELKLLTQQHQPLLLLSQTTYPGILCFTNRVAAT